MAHNIIPMSDYFNLTDFLTPVSLAEISDDEPYQDGQIGKVIAAYENEFPDIFDADIILVGCSEQRGSGKNNNQPLTAAAAVRKQFYKLFYWHTDLKLADIGDIKTGASLQDSYAAVKTVLSELLNDKKTIILIGGSHDLTLGQYEAYCHNKQIIEVSCVDALIDLNISSSLRSDNFLMELLTSEPNFVRHYNHIGFQSFYVHPSMLETMDKLRFDCYRVGNVKESMDEMEPVIRNCQMLSFDISAIAHAYAPASSVSPNGFNGEESCMLMRYAGLSPNTNSIGIYGYDPSKDTDDLTAKQIRHMIWYLLDGRSRGKREAKLEEKESFNEFYMAFAEVQTVFLQSKKTGRWWMQLPDKKFIACSYKDYLLASSNEIPERWLRAQERS
ncbi:MAG TPA: formimidoylglutamase [Chitinophagaceae bacterium]|nr:formimidoylglutamase [Chitinophagaceae bacterium]